MYHNLCFSSSLAPAYSELTGHTSSLYSCVFSPDGQQAATLASDDKLRLYSTTSLSANLSPQCHVRHNNHVSILI